VSGEYRLNDRLPSERFLVQRYSVTRGTIRSALKQLANEGLLTIKSGSGSYIAYSNQEETIFPIIQSTSPLELVDTRLALEPQVARLAVLHATTQDIENLKKALSDLEANELDWQSFSKADEEFHRLMVECSHNSLLIWIHEKISQVRNQTQWNFMKKRTLKADSMKVYNQHHRSIFEAIERRDPEAAAALATEHLNYAKASLTQAIHG